jgi:hypothetical protein
VNGLEARRNKQVARRFIRVLDGKSEKGNTIQEETPKVAGGHAVALGYSGTQESPHVPCTKIRHGEPPQQQIPSSDRQGVGQFDLSSTDIGPHAGLSNRGPR